MPPQRRSWSPSRADGFSTLSTRRRSSSIKKEHTGVLYLLNGQISMEWRWTSSHGMIGQVERGIGVLKDRMIRHLRSSEGDPREAAWAMVTAHTGLVRVGGYSPQQWVFGRNFTDADRLHDGQDLPFWSSVSSDEWMRKSLEIRMQAETSCRKATVEDKISRARNSQSRPVVKYYPEKTWSSMFLGCVWRGGMDLRGSWHWRRR